MSIVERPYSVFAAQGEVHLSTAPSVTVQPRIVLARETWRIIERHGVDSNGIERPYRVIETREGFDALDQPRWKQLDAKSASYSAWELIARELIAELLGVQQ